MICKKQDNSHVQTKSLKIHNNLARPGNAVSNCLFGREYSTFVKFIVLKNQYQDYCEESDKVAIRSLNTVTISWF